jgi:signal peptidase I
MTVTLLVLFGLTLVVVTCALLARRLVAVTVRGMSMEPTYRDGDRVLVRRGGALTPGQVVVLEESGGWLIKRVAAVPGDPVPRDRVPALAEVREDRVPEGKLVLLGDNQDVSMDSREVGYFPVERVLGAVSRVLPPPGGRA